MNPSQQIYFHCMCLIKGNWKKSNKRQFHFNGIYRALTQIRILPI